MGEETQKLENKDPTRLWFERQLGRALFVLIPGVLMTFAAWIYTIGIEISELKSSWKQNDERWKEFTEQLKEDKENEAQWSALLRVEEKTKSLEIDVELFKRMVYLTMEKDVDPEIFRLHRAFPRVVPDPEIEDKETALKGDEPEPKPPVTKPVKPVKTPTKTPVESTAKPKPFFRPLKPIVVTRNERLNEFRKEHLEQIQQRPRELLEK